MGAAWWTSRQQQSYCWYIVAFPFRPNATPVADNRASAFKRFLNLEKRLNANPESKLVYDSVLQEYLDLNHMRLAVSSSPYLLPHHAVYKDSSTTKVKVVFDASAKDPTGVSLNDRLYIGPKLQQDITRIFVSAFYGRTPW